MLDNILNLAIYPIHKFLILNRCGTWTGDNWRIFILAKCLSHAKDKFFESKKYQLDF